MTLNSAVRDKGACRNAANRSLLVLLGCLNFRVCGSHTEGAKRIAASQGGGEYFCGRETKLVLGKESATRQGEKYSQASLRPQGGSRVSVWRDRKPEIR